MYSLTSFISLAIFCVLKHKKKKINEHSLFFNCMYTTYISCKFDLIASICVFPKTFSFSFCKRQFFICNTRISFSIKSQIKNIWILPVSLGIWSYFWFYWWLSCNYQFYFHPHLIPSWSPFQRWMVLSSSSLLKSTIFHTLTKLKIIKDF